MHTHDPQTRLDIVDKLYRVSRELAWDALHDADLHRDLVDAYNVLSKVIDQLAADIDGQEPWITIYENILES